MLIGLADRVARGNLCGVAPATACSPAPSAPTKWRCSPFPSFWLGILLIWLFGLHWRVLPTTSAYVPFTADPVAALRNTLLPALTLGLFMAAILTRFVRSAVAAELDRPYIRTARAKGASDGRVLLNHALRNASLPIVTIVGLQLGAFIGGTVITESVFNYPGLGRLVYLAVSTRDYPGRPRRAHVRRRQLRGHQHGCRPRLCGARSAHQGRLDQGGNHEQRLTSTSPARRRGAQPCRPPLGGAALAALPGRAFAAPAEPGAITVGSHFDIVNFDPYAQTTNALILLKNLNAWLIDYDEDLKPQSVGARELRDRAEPRQRQAPHQPERRVPHRQDDHRRGRRLRLRARARSQARLQPCRADERHPGRRQGARQPRGDADAEAADLDDADHRPARRSAGCSIRARTTRRCSRRNRRAPAPIA